MELIDPLLPAAKPGGRPRTTDLREVLNTLFYLDRTGCQRDLLPHDLLPKTTVYEYFAAWREHVTWQAVLDALRQRVRVADGREPTPSAGSIDSQSVKTAGAGGEAASTRARRFPAASGISASTRRACSWRWSSPQPRQTTQRRPRGC